MFIRAAAPESLQRAQHRAAEQLAGGRGKEAGEGKEVGRGEELLSSMGHRSASHLSPQHHTPPCHHWSTSLLGFVRTAFVFPRRAELGRQISAEGVGTAHPKQTTVLSDQQPRGSHHTGPGSRAATHSKGTESYSDTSRAVPTGHQFPGAYRGFPGGLPFWEGRKWLHFVSQPGQKVAGTMPGCLLLRLCSRMCPSRQGSPR